MNGNGNSDSKVIDLLERIAQHGDILERHGQMLDRIAEELGGMRGEIAGLRGEMRQGFAEVNGRLDNALKLMGGYHADHEDRINALEAVVFKP